VTGDLFSASCDSFLGIEANAVAEGSGVPPVFLAKSVESPERKRVAFLKSAEKCKRACNGFIPRGMDRRRVIFSSEEAG
jgi:hypothetical protein